jgi:hypothetical protein
MTVTARRKTTVVFAGDVAGTQEYDAAYNTDSPGVVQIATLASGNNTVTVPSGGTTPTCVTIVKPSDNTTAITFKGIAGDTGVRLHDTDPDSISIHSGVTSFVLHCAAEIVGVRVVWS